jgi:hypothetical protein
MPVGRIACVLASRRAALGLVAGALLGAAGAAPAQEATAPGVTHIGRYEVVRGADALVVRLPRDTPIGLGLVAGGLALSALGAALLGSRRRTAGGLVLLGLGVAGVGGVALVASASWTASRAELLRERSGRRVERWPREAIVAVEVVQRPREAPLDLKSGSPPRRWEVRVRGSDGERLPARFTFEMERDARALARALGAALGVDVRER